MNEDMTITLHVVTSIDGYIARHDNDVSWLESPNDAYEAGVSEESQADVADTIDFFVLGSHTYEHTLELGWPYGDTPTIVITNRNLSSERPNVEFLSGDLTEIVTNNLSTRFRNIWLCGGAKLSQSFLELNLVDAISLVIAPVSLGSGLRLFDGTADEKRWKLKNVTTFNTGFVELVYVLGSG